MRKLIISIIITGMLIFGMSMGVMAETSDDTSVVNVNISEIALVGAGAPQNLVIGATGIDAGNAPNISTVDTSSVLKYTSIVETGKTRKIQAKLNSLILGCDLALVCENWGSVEGSEGTTANSNAELTPLTTTSDQNLVTGIVSSYSGSTGAILTYTLTINDISNVKAASNSLTVTFTITADDA